MQQTASLPQNTELPAHLRLRWQIWRVDPEQHLQQLLSLVCQHPVSQGMLQYLVSLAKLQQSQTSPQAAPRTWLSLWKGAWTTQEGPLLQAHDRGSQMQSDHT